jgi:hypothetical protein
MKTASKMSKIGIALTLAILTSSVSAYAHSASRVPSCDNGPYHQDRLPDGTVTGPLDSSANGS